MVLRLALDVLPYSGQLVLRDREDAISVLPGEPRNRWDLALHLLRRTGLDLLNKPRTGLRTSQGTADMHVVLRAADLVCWTAVGSRDGGHVAVEIGCRLRRYQRRTVLGAEDDVDQDVRQGLRHPISLVSPFQGLGLPRSVPQGAALGCPIAPLRGLGALRRVCRDRVPSSRAPSGRPFGHLRAGGASHNGQVPGCLPYAGLSPR